MLTGALVEVMPNIKRFLKNSFFFEKNRTLVT